MAFLMLFSSLCVGANAVEAEQPAEEIQAQAERIVLTDDELKEKFGIEKILLPEGFDPVAYVYYNGIYYNESYPEYLTLVFTDGTTITEEERKDIVGPNGKEFYFRYEDYGISDWTFFLYGGSHACFNIWFIGTSEKYEKLISFEQRYKKVSFLSNLKSYIWVVLFYYTYQFIFTGHEPKGGGIFERDYFLPEYIEDIKKETMDFIHWYIDEI